ncbi:hypothetical protein [Haladaptatus sp. AB643]|uniref:hypothetical protein n=1 Tax=Haladaptatus sp. AB643 TaxID=2934174 RepID=UPI00209C095C|nr:hypothetical protein [Haladaptatus sp. AB643]MCO8242981.1 hypothetical protein [Haladaptatus sp. AB643]
MSSEYIDIDFHELSNNEKRRLIRKKRIATNSELVTEIPDERTPVRVFSKPLRELILDKFDRGHWSIPELADEFGLQDREVRSVVNQLRRMGERGFTSPTKELLATRAAILRGKSLNSTICHYSLESVPYHARITDPTFGMSLLNMRECVSSFERISGQIPAGSVSDIDEDYAIVIGGFWGIDEQEVLEYLTSYPRHYINTRLLPLPVIEGEENDELSKRFSEAEGVYARYRYDRHRVDEIQETFESMIERGGTGLLGYQELFIRIFDTLQATKGRDPSLRVYTERVLEEILEVFAEEEELVGEDEIAEDNRASLEQELQTILDDSPTPSSLVYERLPTVVKQGVTPREVEETLSRMARVGLITMKETDDSVEYSFETGFF